MGSSQSKNRIYSPRPRTNPRHWGWLALYWWADSCLLPIILFYALWYGDPQLSRYIVFAIITSFWGWSNYEEWAIRLFWLIRRPSYYCPNNSSQRWWTLDAMMYICSATIGLAALELVIGTCFDNPVVRLLSMPGPTMLYCLSLFIGILQTMAELGVRTPVRISSVGQWGRTMGAMATLVEDIGAVDCRLGSSWREAVCARWEGDLGWRRRCRVVAWVWVWSCLVVAVGLTVVVARANEEAAFGIAWAISITFLGALTILTVRWMDVRRIQEWDGAKLALTGSV